MGVLVYSHRMIIMRAIGHILAYIVILDLLETYYGYSITLSIIMKFVFYSNNLLLTSTIFESVLIAKGKRHEPQDIAPIMLFTVLFMFLIEFHNIISN